MSRGQGLLQGPLAIQIGALEHYLFIFMVLCCPLWCQTRDLVPYAAKYKGYVERSRLAAISVQRPEKLADCVCALLTEDDASDEPKYKGHAKCPLYELGNLR